MKDNGLSHSDIILFNIIDVCVIIFPDNRNLILLFSSGRSRVFVQKEELHWEANPKFCFKFGKSHEIEKKMEEGDISRKCFLDLDLP